MKRFDVSVGVAAKSEIRSDIVKGKLHRQEVPSVQFVVQEAYDVCGETRISVEQFTLSLAKFVVLKQVWDKYVVGINGDNSMSLCEKSSLDAHPGIQPPPEVSKRVMENLSSEPEFDEDDESGYDDEEDNGEDDAWSVESEN